MSRTIRNRLLQILALFSTLLLLVGVASSFAAGEDPKSIAQKILEQTGVKGGLVVHVGCGDGKLTAALCINNRYLVHGLDMDVENIRRAREHIRSLGLYGKVSVERWSGKRLPYADNLVNLIVVEGGVKVSREELMRVLAPRGVAYIKGADGWTKLVKPVPKDIDEWTHALHDSDNNAVSRDYRVAPPRYLQWVGSPKWARSHEHVASVSVVVSSGGRIFYIADEGAVASVVLPSRWFLVAGDAFNGILLWKKPIPLWENRLRGFRSGPSNLSRRLVAVGDRVYVTLGYGEPVAALDAATGEKMKTYEGSEGTTEIVYRDGVLYLVVGDAEAQRAAARAKLRGEPKPPARYRILAVEADTGKLLWKKLDDDTAPIMPTTLAVADGRVFFQNAEAIVCLDSRTGKVLWRADRPVSTRRPAWSAPTLVVYKDVVLSADRAAPKKEKQRGAEVEWIVTSGGGKEWGELICFSAKTGKRLWSSKCREGYNSPVDVLIADGLVWTGNLVTARDPGITEGRDPFTGEVKRTRQPDSAYFVVGMPHHRCYRDRATERFLILGRAGVEFIDLKSGDGFANHWIRGVCQYGVVPCNGLLYVPPHSCACYIQAKLNGFNALSAVRVAASEDDTPRLEKGVAYGQALPAKSAEPNPEDWWTYRHDIARSGRAGTVVPVRLKTKWQARPAGGARLTSPVVASGRLFVASINEHTLYALDALTGERLWDYIAGGRIDSPPTVYRGLVLFGCTDGWVYCLRAEDGELVWRFRAAPEERRIVAYDRLESTHPVHGSVLVRDGIVYLAAGRSSFLDGGIYLYGLDIATGRKVFEKRIDNRDPRTGMEPQDIIRGFNMQGALPDILSSDGKNIFMRHLQFDEKGNPVETTVPHLFSPTGFLDDSWWHRSYWLYGSKIAAGWSGWWVEGNRRPAGRLLVCCESRIYGFGRLNQYLRSGSHIGLGGVRYLLFACEREPKVLTKQVTLPVPPRKRFKRKRPTRLIKHRIEVIWSEPVPLLVRAMTLAGDALFIAGVPDVTGARVEVARGKISAEALLNDALAAIEGKKGGLLWAVSPADGKRLADFELDSPPIFDGMIAARGKLYITTLDGSVLCLTGAK